MSDFRNCVEITEALGYDPARYNPIGVADYRVRAAGFELVDTDPEWSRDRTPKARRCGVDADTLAIVVEHNHHAIERRRWGEWESRRDAAQQIVDHYARTDAPPDRWLMDPTKAFDNVGAEPVYDPAVLEAAEARVTARAEAKLQELAAAQSPARRADVLEALRGYVAAGLPLNRNGLPPRKALNEHAGFRIEGWEKRECWPEVQNGRG